MNSADTAIAVSGLTKSYGRNQVLKGINLQVKRGTMLALLGPNGAGKTTIVRILSTLLSSDSGDVTINGHDISTNPDQVRHSIGLTGQNASIDEQLTGLENLVMMGRLYHLTAASAKSRANELLEQFDLTEAADRPAKAYSGGMRRRLDLAASLIATPPIIFLDEPTTGLDPRSRITMWRIIQDLMTAGTTILLTTQYLEEADQLADRIAVVDGGQVIAQGTPAELKSKVGKDRLELSFENPDLLAKAANLLDRQAAASADSLTLTLTINNVNKDVKDTLDKLAKSGIAVSALAVHKPTLDDVFLSLTGRHK